MIDLWHPLAVLSTRLPCAVIEAAVAPKLAHQAKPAKRLAGFDLAGAFDGEFGGGVSPAGRRRLPVAPCRPPKLSGGLSHWTRRRRFWVRHTSLST